MNVSFLAPGSRAEKEARILAAVLPTRNQYSSTATRFPFQPVIWPVAPAWHRPTLAPMNAEPPSSSVLSSLWLQIRAVLDLVLDLSFQRFVTPRLVRMLYVLSLLAAAFYAFSYMFSGFKNGTFTGLFQMATAPLAFLLYLIVARVTVELILAIFRIADHLAPRPDEPGAKPPVKPGNFTDPVR